jgi:hypothetical protein
MANAIKYPFGPVDASVVLSATGTQAISIVNQYTIIDGVTNQASGNRTLNLTIDASVTAGAKIFLKSATAGTQTTIAGTGFTFPTITGVAGKTFTQEYVYDGSTFYPTGTAVQVN